MENEKEIYTICFIGDKILSNNEKNNGNNGNNDNNDNGNAGALPCVR